MAKILSQEEIDALLSNVDGEPDSGGLNEEEEQKITLYDFKHPNLISKEQLRLLENIHEGLVRNFSVFLSAQLRMIVEINLLAVDQVQYSEFVMSIAPPGAIYVGSFDTPHSQFVLELSPQLAIFIVERLFGGRGTFISNIRPISVIEQRIMDRVVDRLAIEISKNWEPVKDFHTKIEKFETNPEFVQIVPASEPVVVVSMEIKIHGTATMTNICYPYQWISNILSTPEVQGKVLFGLEESNDEEREKNSSTLYNTNVDLRAIIGQNNLKIEDFVKLQLGDVIKLGTRINDQIPMYIRNKKMYKATIGEQHGKYSCRINSVLEGEGNE